MNYKTTPHNLAYKDPILWVILTLSVSALWGMMISPVFAANEAEELRGKISARSNEIKEIEEEIEQYQRQIAEIGGEKQTLQNTIRTIDITRQKLAADISVTEKRVDASNLRIEELTFEIADKEFRARKNLNTIASIIRKIDETESNTLVEVILAHDNISDFFDQIEGLQRFEEGISNSLDELRILKEQLEEKRTLEQAEQSKLLELNDQLGDQKYLADSNRWQKTALLEETQNKESNYKKLLDEKIQKKKQFEKEIEDFEQQLRVIIDPNSIPEPGTKALLWPLDNVYITQKFGRTSDSGRLYVSGTHNGIDLRAARGTVVHAAANGTVVAVGDTDRTCKYASYGKWVLIKHKNGLSTLYGHLDLIKVQEGQEVKSGNIIGYSGNSGYSTGPHLHFTVFASVGVQVSELPSRSCTGAIYRIPLAPKNAYLDPQSYL